MVPRRPENNARPTDPPAPRASAAGPAGVPLTGAGLRPRCRGVRDDAGSSRPQTPPTRPGGRVVMQRTANPFTSVRFRPGPPHQRPRPRELILAFWDPKGRINQPAEPLARSLGPTRAAIECGRVVASGDDSLVRLEDQHFLVTRMMPIPVTMDGHRQGGNGVLEIFEPIVKRVAVRVGNHPTRIV